jgi:hypothetical protein
VNVNSDCIFGKIPISFETIFATAMRSFAAKMQIGDSLQTPRARAGWYDRLTSAVRAGLADVGANTGAELCPYEVIVDHVLFLKDGGGILLAAESEWHQGDFDIKQDFQKLLYVKAPIKVFVCWPSRVVDPVPICCEGLASFAQRVRGEKYLLMELGRSGVRGFGWEASNDGQCPSARFQEISGSPLRWSTLSGINGTVTAS